MKAVVDFDSKVADWSSWCDRGIWQMMDDGCVGGRPPAARGLWLVNVDLTTFFTRRSP